MKGSEGAFFLASFSFFSSKNKEEEKKEKKRLRPLRFNFEVPPQAYLFGINIQRKPEDENCAHFPRSQGNLRLGLVSPLKPNRWNLSAQIMLEIDRRVGEGFSRPKTTGRNKQKTKTNQKNQKKRGLRGKPKPLITNPKPQSLSYFRLRSSVSCKLTFITQCRARALNILSLPSKRFQRDGNFLPSDPVSLLRDC